MKNIIIIRQYIKIIYTKCDVFIIPLLKFVLALICLSVLNSSLGYMERIDNIAIVLIVALMCSFMPLSFIVIMGGLFSLLHMYALSLESLIVCGALFLMLLLLYFRLAPRDTLAVILVPVCFALKIPYIMPVAVGLLATPVSAVAVACGVISYYVLHFINQNATTILGMEEDGISTKLKFMIDGLLSNKEMIVVIFAFSITIIVVYLIRRLSIDHSWTIASVAGAVVDVVALLIGDLMFDINASVGAIVIESIFAIVIAMIIQFFAFHMDYSRTEHVQFEDDEYYYYVKAVPKVTVANPERRVKRISHQPGKKH